MYTFTYAHTIYVYKFTVKNAFMNTYIYVYANALMCIMHIYRNAPDVCVTTSGVTPRVAKSYKYVYFYINLIV
jgi:hypothetical protein